jgi:hypothetical protein
VGKLLLQQQMQMRLQRQRLLLSSLLPEAVNSSSNSKVQA